MKKNKVNLNNLVKKVIEESLQEKADELTKKVKSKMDERTPNSPVNISTQSDDISEEDDTQTDYVMDKIKRECEENPRSESCMKHKKYAGLDKDGEMDETLYGGQKKLDKNKNGRIDKKDFEMLRGDVEEGLTDYFEDDYKDIHDYLKGDDEDKFHPLTDMGEKDTAMSRMRRGKGDVEDIDFEEMDEEEVEEGNAFTGALAKTKKGDKFNLGGKSYTDRSNLEEAEKFIQKAVKKMDKKGVKHKKKSVKESVQLSESEMIDLIEKIVMEETKNLKFAGVKPKGLSQTEKVLTADKKENDDYIQSVTKKMKEYLKNGSKGEYDTNPKTFPRGNGQIEKMDKKAYTPSDAVDEYVDAFAYPGQTNLVFDEIKPDEKKIKKYLKGDKTTGNAEVDEDGKPLGNVVPSEVGEKFNKNYEENLYGQEQKNASYKRYPQDTIDVAGDVTKKGKLKKGGKKTAQSVLDKIDELASKKETLLNEEFGRIKNLMGYTQKTQ